MPASRRLLATKIDPRGLCPPRRGAGWLHPGALDRLGRRTPEAYARTAAGAAQGQRQTVRRRDPCAGAGPRARPHPDRPALAYARDDRPWGGPEPPGVAFVYSGNRATSSPALHLAGFRGVLQVDGYGVYKALAKDGAVDLAFCWAHARRYVTLRCGPPCSVGAGV